MNRKFLSCSVALALLLLVQSPLAGQSLRGSPASVDRIHRQALNHQLRFFESGNAIQEAVRRGELVQLESNRDFRLVDVSYPFVLPPVRTFVQRIASQYRNACGEELVVTSATRPTSMRLINSVDKSVHPTGMAVDLRRPSNGKCLNWLRTTLLTLDAAGVLEAVEERNPPHFHVAVFPDQYTRYVQGRPVNEPQLASASASRPALTTAASSTKTYRVRPGDSLWTIARRNNTSVESLQRANNLRSSRILAGQVLRIP